MPIVLELWRWPVDGMGGESVPSLRVDAHGVGGDRAHAVHGADHLAGWHAAYPFNIGASLDPASPPLAVVTSPRGRAFTWNDPRLVHALEDHAGHPVRLERTLGGHHPVVVCWGDHDPQAVRANIRLDSGEGLDEPGFLLEFPGQVRLRVLGDCERGGVYTRVAGAGRIATGVQVSGVSGR